MDEVTRAITDCWPGETKFVVLRKKDWKKIRAVVRSSTGNEIPFDDMVIVPLVLDN